MRCALTLAAVILVTGCSAQPTPKAAAATTYAPTELPPATKVDEALKMGYKIVNEDGKTLYCRETTKLGSHVRKDRVCLTAEELATVRDANQRNFENMKKAAPPPQGK